MEAVIISIGEELVRGRCLDTNSAWLSDQLSTMGIEIARHVTVGDDTPTITAELKAAIDRGGLVIATGGLGPTPDDRTRQALAAAIEQPLIESPEALAQITAFFARIDRPMRDSNRVQALIPEGCIVLDNPRGTAPGIRCDTEHACLFVLPGVPSEMIAMFDRHVAPHARQRAGGARSIAADIRCFGMTEARIGDLLADMMADGRNPHVGTGAAEAIITVRIMARGENESDARALLDADVAEVRRRLGDACLGPDVTSLQQAVGALLIRSGKTVATAESCTGGLLASRLTEIPSSSAYFIDGVVTYSNEAKRRRLGVPADLIEREGAVSAAVCHAMALGCLRTTGADYALSITGIAGPGGGTPEKPVGLVHVALAEHRPDDQHRDHEGAASHDQHRDHEGAAPHDQYRDREGAASHPADADPPIPADPSLPARSTQTTEPDPRIIDSRRLLLGDHLTRRQIQDRAAKAALNILRLELLKKPTNPTKP